MRRVWICRMAVLGFVLAMRAGWAAPWFYDTFDSYNVGPLRYQGGWEGLIDEIEVVTTGALSGKAVWLDADRTQLPIPVQSDYRLLDFPTAGRQKFSFAVKVDTTTPGNDVQASLDIMTEYMNTLSFTVLSKSVIMTAQHPLLDLTPATAEWDLGTSEGGHPDFTTGTYHTVDWVVEFDSATSPPSARLIDVRLDGESQAANFTHLPAVILIGRPNIRVSLTNGSTLEGTTPDAVYFDNLSGRAVPAAVRRWVLY